jgi:hypothetical protein
MIEYCLVDYETDSRLYRLMYEGKTSQGSDERILSSHQVLLTTLGNPCSWLLSRSLAVFHEWREYECGTLKLGPRMNQLDCVCLMHIVYVV